VECSISPPVSETSLFPADLDCRACCDRFISPEDSEDVIDSTIFILISQQESVEALPPLHLSSPIPRLSFLFLTPCGYLSFWEHSERIGSEWSEIADLSTAHVAYISGARLIIIRDFEEIHKYLPRDVMRGSPKVPTIIRH
jgi:hypothetical protein